MILHSMALAALVALGPKDGSPVATLPDAQKRLLSIATEDARCAALASGRFPGGDSREWRAAAPLVLRWAATAGETGPWRIRLGTDAELADGVDHWVFRENLPPEEGVEPPTYRFEVPRPNLELGRTYYWRVWGNVKCPMWTCGSATGPDGCACGRTGPSPCSPVASFATEDLPPRWIGLEGRTGNLRDLGGWRTEDGRRVRQGMAFRGEAMNDNSVNGEAVGRCRLMVEDVAYLLDVLKIRTDLDLRTPRELSTLGVSPLGRGVRFVRRSSQAYKALFTEEGRRAMGENFRLFCDEASYPVYFHCVGGADRTGSLAYVLNGVLGVPPDDLEKDWESTFYPNVPRVREDEPEEYVKHGKTTDLRNVAFLRDGIMGYGGADTAFSERVALFLMDCGVSRGEIERFRSIMLEPYTDSLRTRRLSFPIRTDEASPPARASLRDSPSDISQLRQ